MQSGLRSRLTGKVVVEALTASFRHPHFLIGRQLTFEAPPPSTIHGLLAAAAGDYPDPASFEFGYIFSAAKKASDLEKQHVIYRQGGKLESDGVIYPKNIEGSIQPYEREFLFRPRLELYLDPPELADVFLTPAYCLSLGRSQDLAAVVSVERCTLHECSSAYLENTLLPFEYRPHLPQGVTLQMPHWIGPAPRRETIFKRYIQLRPRVFAGEVSEGPAPAANFRFLDSGERCWWTDPGSPLVQGLHRGIVFHSLTK
jgi:CRISPR-associated protein Cas5t